ncbi:MAG: PQQ-dependent sugar dehydrogenase [Herpetosiphonaceae bacterium]|nr:PQQ-dependent sugar dehydrogenase [Herpetosiphonaceae bacterium]
MFKQCSSRRLHYGPSLRAFVLVTIGVMVATGCQGGASTPAATTPTQTASAQMTAPVVATTSAPTTGATAAAGTTAEQQPIAGGPVLLRTGISLRKIVDVNSGSVKLARNPVNGQLYFLNPGDGISRVDIGPSPTATQIVQKTDVFTDGVASGMTFGPDGTLFIVANRKFGRYRTQALIRKGVTTAAGGFTWTTLATTEPYPLSATPFDHLWNGIVASSDGQWIFVNAGSRTDHGEVESNTGSFPDTRDVALTAKIFRLPAKATDLVLPNDDATLTAQGRIFARGTRNAFDLQFAPNGDLFAIDNGPDADFPDELNWLREGHHYGFPWRFGNQDNPQQFPGYDSSKDLRLSQDFTAVRTGTYRNDTGFPKPPGPFTNPVINLGPDGAQFRAEDGTQHDAGAEHMPLYTFTPHRSPLGLVFGTDAKLPVDLRSTSNAQSAFVLSYGAAAGTLTDKGQDLLHLTLTKRGDNYEAVTTQLAREFKYPISEVMIENRLYVLEYGSGSAIWELTFK